MLTKSACLWRPLTTRTRRKRHEDEHFGEFSKPVGLMGFSLDEFFNLRNAFVSVIVFALNHDLRVSCFFGIKSDRVTVTKLAPILDGTWTSRLSRGCLFVVSSPWIFLKERLDTTKLYYNHFYCITKRERSISRIFLKIALIAKKRPLKEEK